MTTAIPDLPTLKPFVLEVEASALIQLLVFAPDQDTADDILGGRYEEMLAALRASVGLPAADSATDEALSITAEARPALYEEVVAIQTGPDSADSPTEPLTPGAFRVWTCNHEEHR